MSSLRRSPRLLFIPIYGIKAHTDSLAAPSAVQAAPRPSKFHRETAPKLQSTSTALSPRSENPNLLLSTSFPSQGFSQTSPSCSPPLNFSSSLHRDAFPSYSSFQSPFRASNSHFLDQSQYLQPQYLQISANNICNPTIPVYQGMSWDECDTDPGTKILEKASLDSSVEATAPWLSRECQL